MAMCSSLCFGAVPCILVALLNSSAGFNSPNQISIHLCGSLSNRNTKTATRLFQENVRGSEQANSETDPSPEINRKRRARCIDFPSFAYPRSGGPPQKIPRFKVRRKDGARLSGESPSRDVFLNEFPVGNFALLDPETSSVQASAKRTRLLKYRSYARSEPFANANITLPPSLADLSSPVPKKLDRFWVSPTARVLSFGVAYLAFPYLTEFLDTFVTMPPEQLDEATSKFGPGISILYGTFVSLTLSILYNRQQDIQEQVSIESSLITLITRNMLSLFRKDRDSAVEAGQCAADQIRTLVRGSRGSELLMIMYSDPYSRMLELIECKEYELMDRDGDLGAQGVLIGSCRDVLKDLMKIRASRLNYEALALPPTHFFVLTVLTVLILIGFSISILPTVDERGAPSNESSILFGVLCTVYVLFYNFSNDLNNPFQGVYQIRRSSAASHLLEAKWLIANHPLLQGEVDFEEMEEEGNGDVLIRTPGIGDMLFEKSDIFPDGELTIEE